MKHERKRYKATIADKEYTIIGNESKEHMDIVTELVNVQLQEILNLSNQTSMEEASILLAINAVSDQVKKQAQLLQFEAEIQKMVQQIEENAEKLKNYNELETRLKRIEALEQQAKEALSGNGKDAEEIDPIAAQQILNQQVKEKIQQNLQGKSES